MLLSNVNKKRGPARTSFVKQNLGGFTLVESLVATAIFSLIAVGIYQAFFSLSGLVQLSKLKSVAIALANEQLEIARNLPYSDVGIVDSLPAGKIPYQKVETRSGINFLVTTTVRNIDDPFDGTIGGEPNDLSPADYKLVAVEIACASSTGQACHSFQPVSLTTRITPKGLETSSGNGAMFVQVIDANGQAVTDANVKVTNILATTTLIIQDTTNNVGLLQLVDLPPGDLAYRVEASKAGYSSARTYAPGESGIDMPVNLNVTVLPGQLTIMTLVIDKFSNLELKTIDQYCQPVGPFSLNLQGTKYLDAENTILRYNQDQTIPPEGLLNLINLEWDTYNFTPEDNNWAIVGSFPLQSVLLPPGVTSEVKLLLAPATSRGLLVSVKDGATSLPLTDALVTLSKSGEATQSQSTSRGFFRDTDWSGAGSSTDGGIEVNDPAGEIKLETLLDHYVDSGYLISRVFDAGTASTTFYNLVWQPSDQASSTSVRLQLATSDDPATTTWNFFGPDGTAGSFYTVSGDNINPIHNNQRYLRYKVFLATEDEAYTPNLSEIALTYSSECLPFGQVYFSDLSLGTYEVLAENGGYQDHLGQIEITNDWQILEITLNPE